MLNPLLSHMQYLKNTIQHLKGRLASPGLTIEEVEDIELQLSLSEDALDHYRKAYELELRVAGPEPPTAPSGGENPREGRVGEGLKPGKGKKGLAAARRFRANHSEVPTAVCCQRGKIAAQSCRRREFLPRPGGARRSIDNLPGAIGKR